MSRTIDAPAVFDHPLALFAGLVGAALGVAAVAGVVVVPPPPERPVVTAVGAGLVLGGIVVVGRRLRTAVDQADPPAVELRGDVTVPGASLDRAIETTVRGSLEERAAARQRVTDRIREVAAGVLATVERVPVDEAEERVAAGEWPADTSPADVEDEPTGQVTRDRLRQALGRRTSVERSVARTVAALAEATPGLSGSDPEGTPSRAVERAVAVDGEDADPDLTTGPGDRRTRRWVGVVGAAMLAVGVGIFATLEGTGPSLVVASAAVVGAAGYAVTATAPEVSLAVERRVDDDQPDPGEDVEVTVTVEHTGESWLADLRVVDGVPDGLRVVEGSPRYATALRPGESVRFSYVVEATRGDHAFDPLRAVARDASGATERERPVEATGATTIECVPDLDAAVSVPVFAQAARRTGRVRTDTGGEGVEFHSVREYRRGDPLSRVDWNRVATAGEFATLQFNEERAATVVVVVDARRPAYVTGDPAEIGRAHV